MSDILILGGTGKTGGRVARRLREAGHRVRAASRTSGDVRFDLGEPSTWPAALDGVTAAYLLEPDVQGTEEGRQRMPRFVAAAERAGVRRVALLTAPGVQDNENHPMWPSEQAVRNSGLEWTILQPTWFAQNFSESFWLPGIMSGSLALPTGDGATPFIDADDIADVATAALTTPGHDGHTYVLTGPKPVTFGEATDLIGNATGRTVRYQNVDPEAFVEAQVAWGVPAAVARMLAGLYASIRSGEAAGVADGVERALGRPGRTFEEFVTAATAAGAWNSAES